MCDAAKLRALNDAFRQSLTGGRVMVTPGVLALPDLPKIMRRVRSFAEFDDGNDPHKERDFGAFTEGDQQIFWKIDAYDADLNFGSPDPCDPAVTTRVLTILLASEY
jgi:Protein of unknown function (DUF3768)